MAVLKFLIPILLVSVSLVESADKKESKFVKKVRSLLSDSTFKKIFGVNASGPDEVAKAVQLATSKFDSVIGASIADELSEELTNEGRRLASVVTPSVVFFVYANALEQVLRDNGKLTPENLDKLAESYVKYLDESADNVNGTEITYTLPALTRANAKFFKSLGLTSQKFVNRFAQYLLNQLHAAKK